jgi:hypothetical protein
MKRLFIGCLIISFPISVIAQLVTYFAPLKVGNAWTYRGAIFGESNPSQIIKYIISDTTEINGRKYYRLDVKYKYITYKKPFLKFLNDTGTLLTVTKDSFYAYYEPDPNYYPDSLFRYFKTNIKMGDTWDQIVHVSGNVHIVSTVHDTFTVNAFGREVLAFGIGKKDSQSIRISSEIWTKEFGMLQGSFEQFVDYLWGCVIDGVVYGDTTITTVENVDEKVNRIFLLQNYPNPFNPSTDISFLLPKVSKAVIKVYDVLGREVSTLINEEKPAGINHINFDGRNLSSGVYFYSIKVGEVFQTKKMVLAK